MLLEGTSPLLVIFRPSTAGVQAVALCACLPALGLAYQSLPLLSGQLSLNVPGLSVQASQGLAD